MPSNPSQHPGVPPVKPILAEALKAITGGVAAAETYEEMNNVAREFPNYFASRTSERGYDPLDHAALAYTIAREHVTTMLGTLEHFVQMVPDDMEGFDAISLHEAFAMTLSETNMDNDDENIVSIQVTLREGTVDSWRNVAANIQKLLDD